MRTNLREELSKLETEHNIAIDKVNFLYIKERNELINKHSYYKLGEFVQSVIGIIKIDKVLYDNFGETYVGLPYWYGKNNTLVRTKSKELRELSLSSIKSKLVVDGNVIVERIPKND